jgi:hypothetical protein
MKAILISDSVEPAPFGRVWSKAIVTAAAVLALVAAMQQLVDASSPGANASSVPPASWIGDQSAVADSMIHSAAMSDFDGTRRVVDRE